MGVLITTSRKPSKKTRSFCKDLRAVLPGSEYKNRGKSSLSSVLGLAESLGKDLVLNVYEDNANPSSLAFIKKKGSDWVWGPSLKVKGVRLIREVRNAKYHQFKDLSLEAGAKEKAFLEGLFGADYFTEGSELVMKASKDFEEIQFHLDGTLLGPIIKVSEVMESEKPE